MKAIAIGRRRVLLAALVSSALGLGLGGCQTGYGLPPPISDSVILNSPDVRAAASAVERALRRSSPDSQRGARFAPGALTAGLENDFTYAGFALVDSSLLRYGAKETGGNGRLVAGTLAFKDPLGRRTEVLYYADYRFAGGGIELTEARVSTLFALFPEPLMFVVPAEVVAQARGGLPRTHVDFLRFVADHAVDWTRPEQIPRGEREYVIFVVLMDRVSPSAILEVKIADKPGDSLGYKDSSKYLDFNGWRVGFVPGRFALDRAPLYVKAVFRPGTEVGFGGGYERLVGTFPLDSDEARKQAAKTSAR